MTTSGRIRRSFGRWGAAASWGVLICDGSLASRSYLHSSFAGEPDFEVVGEACDGFECLSQVAATSPDVVILDMELPSMDGLEALPLVRIRAPDALIILLCDHESAELRKDGRRLGASAVLSKRISPGELIGIARRGVDSGP